jgi:flagellum-specific peptidoglycan hydrolase FlgJ
MQYHIPASVVMAQSILESGWGESQLAREANNLFGIKANRSTDQSVEFPTTEYLAGEPKLVKARFARFMNLQECFDAHARLLSFSPRYQAALAAADDPVVFAVRLQECGYSTDPDYAQKLLQLIERYGLRRFDLPRGHAA